MNIVMPLWIDHPSCPGIEEAPARSDRNSLAAAGIRMYNLPRVPNIENGTVTDKAVDCACRTLHSLKTRKR